MMSTQDYIVNTALSLFLQKSYDSIKFKDIAAKCGISTAAIRYYFPNKDYIGKYLLKRFFVNFSNYLEKDPHFISPNSFYEKVIFTQCSFYKLLFSNTKLLNLLHRLLNIEINEIDYYSEVFVSTDNKSELETFFNYNLTLKMFSLLVQMYKNNKTDKYLIILLSSKYYLKMLFDIDLPFSNSDLQHLIKKHYDDIVFQFDDVNTFFS